MKKIFGITALLAVIAMGLTFVACPQDNDIREVTFVNNTKSIIDIKFSNVNGITLPAASTDGTAVTAQSATVTKTGEDIILLLIVFGAPEVNDEETFDAYVDVQGAAILGKQAKNGGVSLKSGIINFYPKKIQGPNPIGWKISGITVGDE